ncbi:hypothetical protein ACLB2K_043632 [Fragaria x ananassa]
MMIQMLMDLIINETFSLVLAAISLILLYRRYSGTSTTKNSPPSPPKLPIIGNLHQLKGPYIHRSLQALSQRHSAPDLMLLHFGSFPVIVVSSAEAATQVFKTHDLTFSSRPKLTAYGKLLYNYKDVASAPYGEYWRQVKSICVLNLLSSKRVRSYRGVREEETKIMINNIEQYSFSSSGRAVDLSKMFARLTIDILTTVALGRKYSSEDDVDGKMFEELLKEFMGYLACPIIGDMIPWIGWFSHFSGLHAKIDKVAKRLDEFLDRVVQEHVDRRSKSTTASIDHGGHVNHTGDDRTDEDQKDFVDVLLEIQEGNLAAGFPFDIVTIKALILDMFAGGTDTTYTVLEWAMTELLRHPKVMRRLQNEVRGIVGNRDLTEDDLIGMDYLRSVIKETLRLHPPFSVIFRLSTEDVTIKGYNIKANTRVILNMWQIGRDPMSYNKVEEFEPERFLNSPMEYKGNDFQFIPFGVGRRGCPGTHFAISATEIVLASLVHKFDWALPNGAKPIDIDMTESTGATTHRKHPLKAIASPYFSCG